MALIPIGEIPAFQAARRGAETIALKQGHDSVSWGELDRRSTRRAWSLKAAGVKANDLVTLALPNGALFYEMTFALWKLGATPHVVSWRLPQRELAAILDVVRPKLLVSSQPDLLLAFGGLDPTASLIGAREIALPVEVAKHWKAMSSGGSTGRPKIIIDHMPGVVDPDVDSLRLPRDEVVLNPGPLYHNAPFLVTHRALFKGNTVIGMARFDPEEALRLIAVNRVSWINMVPTMMLRMWRLPPEVKARHDVTSLRTVWHMAAPMPIWLKESWIEWIGAEKIWELYGGTERQGSTILSGTEWLEHKGSVGRPVACTLRILDDAKMDVRQGEIGEVFFLPDAGAGSTYHYLGADAKRADDGFESLGDFGWMDADGYLYIADRRTDMILSGGANIYPAEVEAALMEHPDVEVAVVIGLPHEDLGAAAHAIVKPHDGARIDEERLASFVSERLARYKTPRSYEFTTEPLRDDAGKVRRAQLREERIS
jgi:bile acid-coenzyme A ligase